MPFDESNHDHGGGGGDGPCNQNDVHTWVNAQLTRMTLDAMGTTFCSDCVHYHLLYAVLSAVREEDHKAHAAMVIALALDGLLFSSVDPDEIPEDVPQDVKDMIEGMNKVLKGLEDKQGKEKH